MVSVLVEACVGEQAPHHVVPERCRVQTQSSSVLAAALFMHPGSPGHRRPPLRGGGSARGGSLRRPQLIRRTRGLRVTSLPGRVRPLLHWLRPKPGVSRTRRASLPCPNPFRVFINTDFQSEDLIASNTAEGGALTLTLILTCCVERSSLWSRNKRHSDTRKAKRLQQIPS